MCLNTYRWVGKCAVFVLKFMFAVSLSLQVMLVACFGQNRMNFPCSAYL